MCGEASCLISVQSWVAWHKVESMPAVNAAALLLGLVLPEHHGTIPVGASEGLVCIILPAVQPIQTAEFLAVSGAALLLHCIE